MKTRKDWKVTKWGRDGLELEHRNGTAKLYLLYDNGAVRVNEEGYSDPLEIFFSLGDQVGTEFDKFCTSADLELDENLVHALFMLFFC